MNPVPAYHECDNCGEVIPTGYDVHAANRLHFNGVFGNFIPETRHLCCTCYRYVGGQCDGTPYGDPGPIFR